MEILDIPKITSASFKGDIFIILADGNKYSWNVKDLSNSLLNRNLTGIILSFHHPVMEFIGQQ